MERFKALGYYIILKRVEPKIKKDVNGLELGEEHRKEIRYIRGKVVSVGPVVEDIKPGDIVLYDKIAGNGLETDDELLKCVSVKDIVIVYEDGEV